MRQSTRGARRRLSLKLAASHAHPVVTSIACQRITRGRGEGLLALLTPTLLHHPGGDGRARAPRVRSGPRSAGKSGGRRGSEPHLRNARRSARRPPLDLRFGASGAGAFLGCGVGVGWVTPLSLAGIPVVGELAGSLASSLGSMDAAAGGAGRRLRSAVQRLGVRGLDGGIGCGAMVGYGYGAGLFLAPHVLTSLRGSLRRTGDAVTARLPPQLRPAGSAPTSSSSSERPAPPLPADAAAPRPDLLADLQQLVVRQQNQLGDLEQQVKVLHAALCRLDPTSPGCELGGGGSTG